MSIVLDRTRYAALVSKTLPRLIHNDKELEEFTEALLDFDEIDDPSQEEKELASLLATLIEHYEGERFPLRKATPVETVNFLLEQRSLSAKDLWGVIGSKGTTSSILSGKRKIGIHVAEKLGKFFHVDPSLFIDWTAA